MIAETSTFTIEGLEAREVRVEVDVHRGLPNFQIIGLPDAAVREARERVRAAMVNSGFEFPLRRITACLSPADLRKAGPALDLALASALLVAAGEIEASQIAGWDLAAELSLDGSLRPVRGALAMAEASKALGSEGIIVPPGNGSEAAMVDGLKVRTIDNLAKLRTFGKEDEGDIPTPARIENPTDLPDLADLRGQNELRRSLEIAAAGGHSLLMVGPPGSGKSLAARRLPSILPPLKGAEIHEVAKIGSACGIGAGEISTRRPFRAPHHTVSAAGLIGGGSPARPGEITLAHRGVLYLDELVEFSRPALEALRQPLDDGDVTVVRAAGRLTYPASFQLIAGANPCACGRGAHHVECRCSEGSLQRYGAALEGALAGQIDMHVTLEQPTAKELAGEPGESSAAVRERVIAARERMAHRYRANKTNANAYPDEVSQFEFNLDAQVAMTQSNLIGARRIVATLKLARTLADLADRDQVNAEDVEQAIEFSSRHRAIAA